MNALFWWQVSRGYCFGAGLIFSVLVCTRVTSSVLTEIKRRFVLQLNGGNSQDNLIKIFLCESHPSFSFYQRLLKGDAGGSVIGKLEVFVAFVSGWFDRLEILAALLAFKVASKWEAWSNIQSWPPIVTMSEYALRRCIRSMSYTTFFVGTTMNVAIGYCVGIFCKVILTEKLYNVFGQ